MKLSKRFSMQELSRKASNLESFFYDSDIDVHIKSSESLSSHFRFKQSFESFQNSISLLNASHMRNISDKSSDEYIEIIE
jgi:hypothetical protein